MDYTTSSLRIKDMELRVPKAYHDRANILVERINSTADSAFLDSYPPELQLAVAIPRKKY